MYVKNKILTITTIFILFFVYKTTSYAGQEFLYQENTTKTTYYNCNEACDNTINDLGTCGDTIISSAKCEGGIIKYKLLGNSYFTNQHSCIETNTGGIYSYTIKINTLTCGDSNSDFPDVSEGQEVSLDASLRDLSEYFTVSICNHNKTCEKEQNVIKKHWVEYNQETRQNYNQTHQFVGKNNAYNIEDSRLDSYSFSTGKGYTLTAQYNSFSIWQNKVTSEIPNQKNEVDSLLNKIKEIKDKNDQQDKKISSFPEDNEQINKSYMKDTKNKLKQEKEKINNQIKNNYKHTFNYKTEYLAEPKYTTTKKIMTDKIETDEIEENQRNPVKILERFLKDEDNVGNLNTKAVSFNRECIDRGGLWGYFKNGIFQPVYKNNKECKTNNNHCICLTL